MLKDLPLPATLTVRGGPLTLRRAQEGDLPGLMRLLADDSISASRGDGPGSDPEPYRLALQDLVDDQGNDLLLVEDPDGTAIAMLQLTRTPGLSRRGSTRLLVEAVRVGTGHRSAGLGSAMLRWVTGIAAPALGASLVQLTSDASRVEAHRFYTRLGFVGSHIGFKYQLP
ncbi:MAG: GNAT family N-acetyltransferase [Arthrobacter sp.]|uniref:GNAT family N-acetyltransferase n=1 Tax=unclassified Arthrobacter TaxID=235627 RepID=UPI00264F5683|nr:GNAT family N-acetyltransferase [Micrococcaceae bacterium]MDN5811940.1 GNAT family N-acetyltransferase [Micrococcaceae bacterium]MDN5823544.1 GNAT family N-acetyltransferase [Micrococcaceae bacterium]